VQIGCEPLKTIVMGPLELPGMPSPAIEAALHWLEGLSQNNAPNHPLCCVFSESRHANKGLYGIKLEASIARSVAF
jgi:hypothetical protein